MNKRITTPVPFAPQTMKHFEVNARQLRERACVDFNTAIDPLEVAKNLGAIVVFKEDPNLDGKDWSGTGDVLPNGNLFIMINALIGVARANVTILEELAHHHYRHQRNIIGADGRSGFNKQQEDEAYQTAAAALLPAKAVSLAAWSEESIEAIAQQYGASLELVRMRVNFLGFSRVMVGAA